MDSGIKFQLMQRKETTTRKSGGTSRWCGTNSGGHAGQEGTRGTGESNLFPWIQKALGNRKKGRKGEVNHFLRANLRGGVSKGKKGEMEERGTDKEGDGTTGKNGREETRRRNRKTELCFSGKGGKAKQGEGKKKPRKKG